LHFPELRSAAGQRPGGNIHVAHAPNGATFLAIFNRPNRFFDGTTFFTAGASSGTPLE
jgi:hypothetical protein